MEKKIKFEDLCNRVEPITVDFLVDYSLDNSDDNWIVNTFLNNFYENILNSTGVL